MDDKNFKKVDELSVESDLALAIRLGIEKRDKTIDQFADLLKTGVLKEDNEKVIFFIDNIFKMNESIKLMYDAAFAVKVYKIDQEINK